MGTSWKAALLISRLCCIFEDIDVNCDPESVLNDDRRSDQHMRLSTNSNAIHLVDWHLEHFVTNASQFYLVTHLLSHWTFSKKEKFFIVQNIVAGLFWKEIRDKRVSVRGRAIPLFPLSRFFFPTLGLTFPRSLGNQSGAYSHICGGVKFQNKNQNDNPRTVLLGKCHMIFPQETSPPPP